MKRKAYNLNLAPSYLPEWGAWEVVREIACNAIDADPEGWAIAEEGPDKMTITTSTVPEVAQLFVVGQGTKRPGGDTIGQFGEGVKMAALVATRLDPSGHGLVLRTPTSTICFGMKRVLGVETLHAFTIAEENGPGFRAQIQLPGAVPAYRGRIQPQLAVGPMRRRGKDGMRIFVKGVYIGTIEGMALWDWNFATLDTNRDRAMVNEWDAKWEMGRWLEANITVDQARAMIHNTEAIEAKALDYHHGSTRCREAMAEAFKLVHGGKVLAEGAEVDTVAARKGHQLAYVPGTEVRSALKAAGIPTTSTVVNSRYDLVNVECKDYLPTIAKLRELDGIVKAPSVRVQVFASRDDQLYGYADIDDMVLWLSEALFSDGNTQMLVRTYLHELAHFMTSAKDGSVDYELGLDAIAGRLAMHVLGGSL